jgi:phosphate transport system substrate-binding protein
MKLSNPLKSIAVIGLAVLATSAQAASLNIKGSDTILPLAQRWAEDFMKKSPGANISVTGGGSGVGIKALINGTCDVADASRPMKASEIASAKSRGFVPKAIPVALDGVTFVVSPSNPIKDISVDELRGIYLGQITDWKQVGGPAGKIVTVGRDSSSGTYGFVQEDVLKNANYRADMISLPSNNAIAQTVIQNSNAIGYIGIAYARKFEGRVKILPVSAHKGGKAILPSDATVKNRSYPVARPLFNYTKGNPTGLAKSYLNFVLGPEGQRIVEAVGYVPLH